MIGDARVVAGDPTRDGENGGTHSSAVHWRLVEIVLCGMGKRREVHHFELTFAIDQQRRPPLGIGEGEAGVGAADVGEQDEGLVHGVFTGRLEAGTVTGRNWSACAGPQDPAG